MNSNILQGLTELPSGKIPMLEQWHPPFCGDIDIQIKANGDWVHEGCVIKRIGLIRLFSQVLWTEGNEVFLKTPAEKVRIQVEDAHFLVTDWQWVTTPKGAAVQFTTLTGESPTLGIDCDLWLADFHGEQRPYISMRFGMKALLQRSTFYSLANELIAIKTAQGQGMGLYSAGQHYLLLPDEETLNE